MITALVCAVWITDHDGRLYGARLRLYVDTCVRLRYSIVTTKNARRGWPRDGVRAYVSVVNINGIYIYSGVEEDDFSHLYLSISPSLN